ncbi:MAG: hypothetical protein LBD51_00330 [Bifidobacteriaceae bacterium]|jgi:hypothetical protein|nr:hypothetical protein [Bifidobacteriaceae bacterium]
MSAVEAKALFVGPANFAGQGCRWARAAERAGLVARAESFALADNNRFGFPVDASVPERQYRADSAWQRRQWEHVAGNFSHVLFEAFRPLFGDLFHFDPLAEAAALRQRGLAVAMLAHGSEVRPPSRHARRHAFSPFPGLPEATRVALEATAQRNLALAPAFPGPIFVSTPDLLDYLPQATWCPLAIDQAAWRCQPTGLARRAPVVAHAPSNTALKGTAQVRAAAQELERAGLIEYRELGGVPAAAMPAAIRQADIVLDQFAIGSYGAGAVEAMAAGRLVVGNVAAETRARVAAAAGAALPIAQAEPGALAQVLRQLLADRPAGAALAASGQRFAAQLHDGAAAAAALAAGFLGRAA